MEKDHAMKPLTRPLTGLLSAGALAAALATTACNRNPGATPGNAQAQLALPALPATLPLEAGTATAVGYAPAASDLPDAAPLRLARVADPRQAYGYADAAYSYDEALGDAPPDYGFDYEGADPWAWQGYDDSTLFAEPIDDGYRYYYYRPGADEPYFIRDPYYSYGFAGGLLAVVYAADGGIVPYADYGPRLGYASRYYARGRSLWTASRSARRRPVIAANWLRGRPVILASRERWGAGRAHQPAWQRYSEANRPRQASYWRAEQVRREADARRFADWRRSGFRSSPPPRAIPVAWQNAKWAKDDRRYRPAAEALRDRRDDRPEAQPDRRSQAQPDRREARQDHAEDRRQEDRRDQARADQQPQRDQAQRDRSDRGEREQARPRQAQAERRDAEQAQRQAARTERRPAAREDRRRPEPAQQREARQAERAQAQTGERRQAERAERRQDADAGRRQAEQAQRREAQQADRAQRQQAADAGRRQAEQAQRQQAQQAERQAARQQAQQAQQARQAERPQAQPQRAEPRGERGGGRRGGGPGPN